MASHRVIPSYNGRVPTLQAAHQTFDDANASIRLGLRRSMSFLKANSPIKIARSNMRAAPSSECRDDAIRNASDQLKADLEEQQLKDQELKSRKSSFFTLKPRREQKALKKSVRSSRIADFGCPVASNNQNISPKQPNSFTLSIRKTVGRIFGRSSSKDSILPVQHVDASRPHFRDFVGSSIADIDSPAYITATSPVENLGEGAYGPSPYGVTRNKLDLPELPPLPRFNRDSENRTATDSRLTSWTDSTVPGSVVARLPVDRKRLSIIQEHGGAYQPSSSAGRHLDETRSRTPSRPFVQSSPESSPIDPQRLYAALLRRIDASEADAHKDEKPRRVSKEEKMVIAVDQGSSTDSSRRTSAESSKESTAKNKDLEEHLAQQSKYHLTRGYVPQPTANGRLVSMRSLRVPSKDSSTGSSKRTSGDSSRYSSGGGYLPNPMANGRFVAGALRFPSRGSVAMAAQFRSQDSPDGGTTKSKNLVQESSPSTGKKHLSPPIIKLVPSPLRIPSKGFPPPGWRSSSEDYARPAPEEASIAPTIISVDRKYPPHHSVKLGQAPSSLPSKGSSTTSSTQSPEDSSEAKTSMMRGRNSRLQEAKSSSFFPFSNEDKPETPSPFRKVLAAKRESRNPSSSDATEASVIHHGLNETKSTSKIWSSDLETWRGSPESEPFQITNGGTHHVAAGNTMNRPSNTAGKTDAIVTWTGNYTNNRPMSRTADWEPCLGSPESEYFSATSGGRQNVAAENTMRDSLHPDGMATIITNASGRYARPIPSAAKLHENKSVSSTDWKSWVNSQIAGIDRGNSQMHHREYAQINDENVVPVSLPPPGVVNASTHRKPWGNAGAVGSKLGISRGKRIVSNFLKGARKSSDGSTGAAFL